MKDGSRLRLRTRKASITNRANWKARDLLQGRRRIASRPDSGIINHTYEHLLPFPCASKCIGRIGHTLFLISSTFHLLSLSSCFDNIRICPFSLIPIHPSTISSYCLACILLASTLHWSLYILYLSWIPTYLFFPSVSVFIFLLFFSSSFSFPFSDPHRTIPLPYIPLGWIGFIFLRYPSIFWRHFQSRPWIYGALQWPLRLSYP